MLAGLILAGGLSSRMGRDKAQLRSCHSGLSLLEECEALLPQVGVEHSLISSHRHPDGLRDIIPQCGPISGIHAALDAINKHYHEVSELIVLPVDMPNLNAKGLTKLIRRGREVKQACCYQRCYLPLYLPVTDATHTYVRQLMQTVQNRGNYSLKHMLLTLDGIQIKADDEQLLLNINQPQEWLDFDNQRKIK
ncbi:MAG: molybdopterin-guanine dinucleotide biosynthesis protein A [Paraglaciecola sp.]|jgi:molybdopterin-guanine dinucleotide biosynthesis protein A